MFFDGALIGRANDGCLVVLRELGWQLDVEQYFTNHAVKRIGLKRLHDADSIGWDTSLLAESEHIDAGASADSR